jgi:hypothetical protein
MGKMIVKHYYSSTRALILALAPILSELATRPILLKSGDPPTIVRAMGKLSWRCKKTKDEEDDVEFNATIATDDVPACCLVVVIEMSGCPFRERFEPVT